MKPLQQYQIPIKGMTSGLHQQEFHVDGTFFAQFPEAILKECDVDVRVEMDKRPNMVLLQFEISGFVRTNCDRCMAEIDLPISGLNTCIVKFGESEDFEDEEDVILIHPGTSAINISEQLYDYISLSIPMIVQFECESVVPKPCDEKAKMILQADIEEETEEKSTNPIWEELRNKLS